MKNDLWLLLNFLALKAEQTLCHPANETTIVLAKDENILLARFQSFSKFFIHFSLAWNELKMPVFHAGLYMLEKYQTLNWYYITYNQQGNSIA